MKRVSLLLGVIALAGSGLIGCSSLSKSTSAKTEASSENRFPASKTHQLVGDAAVSFIEKHFPNAEIPGNVEGSFTYTVGKKTGHAKCFYPAMGGRSNGVEPSCDIKEAGKTRHISGDAAAEFIDRYFPDAEIPGNVSGKYKYGGILKKGYAKCFYPAMGGQSNGIEPTCDVTYEQ
jgi:hypothetical protein